MARDPIGRLEPSERHPDEPQNARQVIEGLNIENDRLRRQVKDLEREIHDIEREAGREIRDLERELRDERGDQW